MKFPQFERLFKVFNQSLESSTSLNVSLVKPDLKLKSCRVLHSSLKQLEFISFLEVHLSKKDLNEYSLNFLLELDKIKRHAKNNTIKSIAYCKS
ncbi:hypothetical protein CW732_01205 [Olleya sp. Bg11-27]|nr:hypothetical protein CW732_01205 [Olleya sp. Bg11-27]